VENASFLQLRRDRVAEGEDQRDSSPVLHLRSEELAEELHGLIETKALLVVSIFLIGSDVYSLFSMAVSKGSF
jgi:hypothetical protein